MVETELITVVESQPLSHGVVELVRKIRLKSYLL